MDIRSRYLGTLLGAIWALLFPFINIALIYVVMTYGLKVGGLVGDVSYVNWLVPGMLAWFFISEAVTTSVNAIVESPHLVTKMQFPLRLLVPVKIFAAVPVHALLVVVFAIFLAVTGAGSMVYWPQLLYYLFSASLLILGIGYLTAATQVFVRDTASVIGVMVQILFWATPIFWKPDLIAASKFSFLLYSPFAYIINGYRDSLFGGVAFWHRPFETAVFWIITLTLLILGVVFFERVRPHFADVL